MKLLNLLLHDGDFAFINAAHITMVESYDDKGIITLTWRSITFKRILSIY